MILDEESQVTDIKCICAKPLGKFKEFKPDTEFYWKNPQFLSESLLTIEIHTTLDNDTVAEEMVFFDVISENLGDDRYDYDINYIRLNCDLEPLVKQEKKFWIESINRYTFAVFTDKSAQLYEM